MALDPADETLGRYRLFARLGRGGMAELHLARMLGPAGIEKFVVVKRMLQHLVDDPQFVTMFENEGRIAVRLDHPNVCQTYELGNVDGQLFLVMELVRGLPWSTVATRLPRDELAACQFIVGVITQACEGLNYAHNLTDAAGNPSPVVHRDVTPGNLMITKEGAIKLLDFGVSKLLNDDHATRAGMIKGKLPYMAPEHIRGELVDRRADIFSLAVVTWEALAQQRLFERPSDLKIFKAIVEEPIPPLPQTPITQQLERVLRRALAKDKTERHSSARELADELRGALAPFGPPMTQAQIQRVMSESLGAELAQADEDLAAAISRLRASDAPAERSTGDYTRTEIDFVISRATATTVGVPDVDADTEDDPPAESKPEMKTIELPARTPSMSKVHTAPMPVFDETAEPSFISSAPTVPRKPLQLPVPEGIESAQTLKLPPRQNRPSAPPPSLGTTKQMPPGLRSPGSSRRDRKREREARARRMRWILISLVVASTAVGVIAAILLN